MRRILSRRIPSTALVLLLLSGCIRQIPDTPDIPDTTFSSETLTAEESSTSAVPDEPQPEIPERYTGDLASATGISYTLVDLSDALAEVGFTQRNFQSLYKHCTPLGQGRWAIRYVTDDPTYTERTAVIHPDGTVSGVMEDGKNTMTMAVCFQSGFVLTSAKSGSEIQLDGYPRYYFDRMLYAEELTAGEFFAIRGYPLGDDTPEPDRITDIPCALYNETERLTEFKYRSICKVDGGFEAFYPLEGGGLACELLDEKGQVIGPVESPVYPYDDPYNNYRKGCETIVQWDPLAYSKTGLSGCGLATSGGRPLTETVFQDCTVAVDGTALVLQGDPLSRKLSLLIVTGAEYAAPPQPLQADLSAVNSITYSLCKLENPTRFLPYDYDMSPNMPAPLSDETHHFPAGDGNWYYSCYGQSVRLDFSTNVRIPKVMTLVRPDGSMPTLQQYRVWQKDILTMVLFWDTGDVITSLYKGQNVYKNGELWMEIEDKEKKWATGAPLRDGQYFRISNSAEDMTPYYQVGQWDMPVPAPHYALFRYDEQLTEFRYSELYASGEVFVGIYEFLNRMQMDILDETGAVIATEEANMRADEASLRAKYPETKPVIPYDGLTPLRDAQTGLYYYANAKGDPVCAPAFTECTNVCDGTALVKIGYDVYMLVIESVTP